MKKYVIYLLIMALLLSGCGGKQELPADWEEDWTVVAPLLAVEPFEGFTLHESNDALYLSGIYYATWVTGEARPHTKEEGEEAEVFDGQIYVLLQEYRNSGSAESAVSQWIAREKTTYEAGEEGSLTCNGQAYTTLTLAGGSADNPYDKGAAAFAVRGKWAICVEYLAKEDNEENSAKILEEFLNGFHFSE